MHCNFYFSGGLKSRKTCQQDASDGQNFLILSPLCCFKWKKGSHHLLHGAQVSVVLLSVLILFQPVMGNWGASQQRDCVPGTRSPCFLTSALFVTPGTRKSFRSPSPSQEPSHIRHPLFVPIHLAAHSLGKVRSCLVNVWKRESGQLKKFYQGAISKIFNLADFRKNLLFHLLNCVAKQHNLLKCFMSPSDIVWLQYFLLALPLDIIHKLLKISLYSCLRGKGEECWGPAGTQFVLLSIST